MTIIQMIRLTENLWFPNLIAVLKIRPCFLAGIFLISASTLSLEISLLRYFSISQHYHFAFLVISIAFLGYGTSGSLLTVWNRFGRREPGQFLSFSSFLFSMSILFSFLLCNSIRFDFAKLAWDSSQIWLIFLYFILLGLPFFFAGLILSTAITRAAEFVHTVYFADLIGAGAGSILSLVLFLPRGDIGALLAISLLALFASLLFNEKRSFFFKCVVVSFIMAELSLFFFFPPSWLGFRISPFKALPVALKYPQAKHLLTEWNAISRIDVIDSPAVRFAPGLSLLYSEDLPSQIGLTIDGDGLTAVAGNTENSILYKRFISNLPSSYVYSLIETPKVLVFEPKGGLDLIGAQVNEAELILATESNPLITKILRKDLADFTGNMYLRDNLRIETAHSRTVLERERETFDLIVIPLSDVFGASSTGLFGFGENYLLTKESFSRIYESLTPQGIASMSFYLLPPPRQELKALATWIQVLENKGKDPAQHIASLRSWGTISLFIKKNPFSDEEIDKLREFGREHLFDLVYHPQIKEVEANVHNRFPAPIYYTLFLDQFSHVKREKHFQDYLFDIKPVSDNRPFFYNFFKISRLKETYNAFDRKWLPFLQGEFLVLLLFIQAALIAFVFILLPVFRIKTRISNRQTPLSKVLLYFGLIGTAFMLFEITLIQKFILFLGRPLFSAAIVICSLLVSSGLGSLCSHKLVRGNLRDDLNRFLLIIFLLIIFAFFFFPPIFRIFMGTGFLVRLAISVLTISIFGFFMGIPFPSGIRLLEACERDLIPWGWAANAFSSVLGSIAALLIAFWGGYNLVLLIAGSFYLMAAPFHRFSRKRIE